MSPLRGTATARRGITPVVAIVLLLMMTVAAAGGAYAWVNDVVGQSQEQGEEQLDRNVALRDLVCSGTTVQFYLANTGSADVDANSVTVYQYNVSTGNLITTTDISYGNGVLSAGSDWDSSATVNSMTPGRDYRIAFEFDNEEGYTVDGTCQAT